MDNITAIDFCVFDSNVSKIVIGTEGHGRSLIESLKKNHLLNNNYRKQHKLPLVRKGHPVYRIIKRYKNLKEL